MRDTYDLEDPEGIDDEDFEAAFRELLVAYGWAMLHAQSLERAIAMVAAAGTGKISPDEIDSRLEMTFGASLGVGHQ